MVDHLSVTKSSPATNIKFDVSLVSVRIDA